jgi:hypothetical protein
MTSYTLTARELAAFLGVSDARIRQVVLKHQIKPVYRIGKAHRSGLIPGLSTAARGRSGLATDTTGTCSLPPVGTRL